MINRQPVLHVDMDQCRDTLDFDISAMVDSCRVIRLENRPEALVGRVSEMAFTGSRIYLYHQQKLLMAFDYQGKYREQIGNLGKGPYEYKYLNNLAVSGNGSVILGEPYDIDKYIIFDSTGKGSVMIPRKLDGSHHVMILPDNQVLELGYKGWDNASTDNRRISLYVTDLTGKIGLEKSPLYPSVSYRVGGVTLPVCFYRFNHEYRVHFSRDTLFNLDITNGSLKPVAVFTALQNGFDYHRLDDELNSGVNNSMEYTGKVYAEIHAETSRYYLLRQIRKELLKDGSPTANAVTYFSVDKKDKTAHPVRLKDPFYGMDLEGDRVPMPFTHWTIIDNKYGVLDFQAIELKEEIAKRLKDSRLSPKIKDKLKALDNSISQEDNMVLFVYYLKTTPSK
jgi:hypothetical protein